MKSNRPKAIPTVQISTERVVVTEWKFPPGAETTWHTHQYDYVVVPQTTGQLEIESSTGVTRKLEYENIVHLSQVLDQAASCTSCSRLLMARSSLAMVSVGLDVESVSFEHENAGRRARA